MSDKKVDLPAINYFIHRLSDKLPEVLANGGRDLLIDDKHLIQCNSPYTASFVTELVRLYREMEQTKWYVLAEERAGFWHPASELPDDPHSSYRRRPVLVTSPVLRYVVSHGICLGFEDQGWYIVHDGKTIKHDVTRWRHLPPNGGEWVAGTYEALKSQIDELRRQLGYTM